MSETQPKDHQARYQRIGVAALVAVALVFIWRSLAGLPLGTIDNPGPAAAPLLLASLLIACALWSLAGGASGVLGADVETDAAEPAPGGLRHAVLIVAAVIVAALVLHPLGYRLTILALLLFFLGVVERKPPLVALVVSVALSFGSHALFERVLKIPLPAGPFGI